jgi:hypothetical protein
MLDRLFRLAEAVPGDKLGVLCDVAEKLVSPVGDELHEQLKLLISRKSTINGVARKTYLRQIFTERQSIVGETSGTVTLASSGLFIGGIRGESLSSEATPTPATIAIVHELLIGGKFVDLFKSLGERRKRWQQEQVVRFCIDHRGKLSQDYRTLFEMEKALVVDVSFVGQNLKAHVFSLFGDTVLSALCAHRLISLQQ